MIERERIGCCSGMCGIRNLLTEFGDAHPHFFNLNAHVQSPHGHIITRADLAVEGQALRPAAHALQPINLQIEFFDQSQHPLMEVFDDLDGVAH